MASNPSKILREMRLPLLVGLAYYLAARLALGLSMSSEDFAAFWPASGILLSALLIAPRRHMPAMLVTCGIASMLANYQSGASFTNCLAFTVTDLLEALVSSTIARPRDGRTICFESPADVVRFAFAVLCAAIVSASLCGLLVEPHSWQFTRAWFFTSLLGQSTITPLVITLYREARDRLQTPGPGRYGEFAAIMSLVVVTAVAVFTHADLPLLFVILLPLSLATYRFGPLGTALSVTVIAVVGSVCTVNGLGPCALLNGHEPFTPILFFQFYLLSTIIAGFPLATALAARDRAFARVETQMQLLELAETTGHVGHWQLDIAANRLFWSTEVFRIHDRPIGDMPHEGFALTTVHPEDRPFVSDYMKACIENGEDFECNLRIVTMKGDVRYVSTRVRSVLDADGKPKAVFGVIQDITETHLLLAELRCARLEAEAEAERARIVAETDQLTGVANRRRIMAELEQQIARARALGSDLTLAVLDIDHFKAINDRHGHLIGDAVLRAVACECAAMLRDQATFGRVGGEEFLAILPGIDAAAAETIAESLRERIARGIHGDCDLPDVTVSIGLAAFGPEMSLNELYHAADHALYAAKSQGRNLLRVA